MNQPISRTMRINTFFLISVLAIGLLLPLNLVFSQSYRPGAQNRSARPQATDTTSSRTPEKMLTVSIGRLSSGLKRIFTSKSNLIFLGTGTAASLIVWPHDDEISEDIREDSFGEFEVEVPNKLGNFWVVSGATLFTHLLGRALKQPHLANTGLYLAEAVITTQFVTFLIKESAQRTRPDGSNNLSFPSGHASAMFAVATVLQKRYGYKAGIPAYLLATYVGITRVKTQKHFPTDVIAGATLGTIIARSFVPARGSKPSFAMAPAFYTNYAGINFHIYF